MRLLETGAVLITSTVGVKVMSTASLVNDNVEGLPTTSLIKHAVKPNYVDIKEVHKLLTANEASVEIDLRRVHKSYLNIILPPKKYACISDTTFVCPPAPGITSTVPS